MLSMMGGRVWDEAADNVAPRSVSASTRLLYWIQDCIEGGGVVISLCRGRTTEGFGVLNIPAGKGGPYNIKNICVR